MESDIFANAVFEDPAQTRGVEVVNSDTERSGPTPSEIGRRAQIRVNSKNGNGISVTVMVQEISAKGLRMLHESRIEPGTEFIFSMAKPNGVPIEMLCVAKACERGGLGGANFAISASFQRVLSGR